MRPDLPSDLGTDDINRVIDTALAEDAGRGDLTSAAVIPQGVTFSGVLSSRQDMVVAGLPIAGLVFHRFSEKTVWQPRAADGDRVSAGTELALVSGPAQDMLGAERTALNLLQHLSGIATLTRRYVDAIEGTGATLLDTRKTIPGLRRAAKYATRMGGAENHRMALDDGVLIKDNHIALAGSVSEALGRARQAGLTDIEVECDTLDQVREAVEAGADKLLLDNMTSDALAEAVALVAGRAKTEASGGVTLETIAAIAASGVDYVSVGRITQSAPAVDIGLDWHPAS
ncbi:MAG: carboxylating nicotinate-nucleotide diphosphorylase [Rhodospirillales bacterium]|nr:carboxylating nicotinate-nucleotide diphosphorylase [Rhodospirillales bacterium]